ncbi:MAG: N-6 DNA methylase [Deltaproteobacteria bacterium]|nr:N-6 DNA methylase [Deltaproteobacteria bacterium]
MKKGLSIKKLSALLKINYTYISHIERGKSIPAEHLLEKIANKLGTHEEELKILSGKIPEDIKTILYKYPREAPMLIRDALGSYAALKQISFLKDKEKRLEQFFTPLDIASGMLELIGVTKCNHNAEIIDPSCGDGVFLKAAKEKTALLKIFGCDIDSEHINSINSQIPEGSFIAGNALDALLEQEETFDFAVGNPPFSAQDNLITDKNILNKYRLGSDKKRQAVEILFLELFVRLLKQGGKFSIILPEGILSARPQKYVRDWLASNTVIYSIISLPRNTFKKTSSKCVIISGERNSAGNNLVKYAVFNHIGGGINFSETINMVRNKCRNSIKQAEIIHIEDWRPENLAFIKMRQLCKKPDWACLGELVKLRTGFVKYGKDIWIKQEILLMQITLHFL